MRNIVALKALTNYSFYGFLIQYIERELRCNDLDIIENCMNLLERKTSALHETIRQKKMSCMSARLATLQLARIEDIN